MAKKVAFKKGDEIKVVHKGSKHYGQEGIIEKVGKLRLTVNFNNGYKGRFVQKGHAQKVELSDTDSKDGYSSAFSDVAVTAGTLLAMMDGLSEEDEKLLISEFVKNMKLAKERVQNALE